MHDQKPLNELLSLHQRVHDGGADANQPDAQLQGVAQHRYLRFEEVRDDAVVAGDCLDVAESIKRQVDYEDCETEDTDPEPRTTVVNDSIRNNSRR